VPKFARTLWVPANEGGTHGSMSACVVTDGRLRTPMNAGFGRNLTAGLIPFESPSADGVAGATTDPRPRHLLRRTQLAIAIGARVQVVLRSDRRSSIARLRVASSRRICGEGQPVRLGFSAWNAKARPPGLRAGSHRRTRPATPGARRVAIECRAPPPQAKQWPEVSARGGPALQPFGDV